MKQIFETFIRFFAKNNFSDPLARTLVKHYQPMTILIKTNHITQKTQNNFKKLATKITLIKEKTNGMKGINRKKSSTRFF